MPTIWCCVLMLCYSMYVCASLICKHCIWKVAAPQRAGTFIHLGTWVNG